MDNNYRHIFLLIMVFAFIFCTSNTAKADFLYDEAYKAYEYTNEERQKHGLNALEWDPEMALAAQKRAREISLRFSHERINGWLFSTMDNRMYAENIAYGQSTAADVMYGHGGVKSWMHSQSHKDLILDPDVVSLGVAAYKDEEDGKIYWAGEFSNTKPELKKDVYMRVSRYSRYDGYETILEEADVESVEISQYPIPAGIVQTVRKRYELNEEGFYEDMNEESLIDERYIEAQPEIKKIPIPDRDKLKDVYEKLLKIDKNFLNDELRENLQKYIDDCENLINNPSFQSDINNTVEEIEPFLERANGYEKEDKKRRQDELDKLKQKRISNQKSSSSESKVDVKEKEVNKRNEKKVEKDVDLDIDDKNNDKDLVDKYDLLIYFLCVILAFLVVLLIAKMIRRNDES
ncbi:MAG: CAP domain-containing protein [Tissierellia bacterium]|nr:CAP domain-containing protein [Tissierellia bacterium]